MPALLLTIGARDATASAFRAVSGAVSSIGRITGAALGAATVAATALTAATVAAARSLDDIGNRARNAGVPTDVLQSYRLLADRLGVPVRAADVALQRFNRRVGEAAAGGGQLTRIFNDLGISVRDSSGAVRGIDQILPEFVASVGRIGDEATRSRLAFAAFDSEGVGFGIGMAQLGDRVGETLEEFRDLGLIIDQDVIAGAQNAVASFSLLSDVFRIGTQRVLGALAPALGNLAEVIARTVAPIIEDLSGSLSVSGDVLVGVGRTILGFTRTAAVSFVRFVADVSGALSSVANAAAAVGNVVASVAGHAGDRRRGGRRDAARRVVAAGGRGCCGGAGLHRRAGGLHGDGLRGGHREVRGGGCADHGHWTGHRPRHRDRSGRGGRSRGCSDAIGVRAVGGGWAARGRGGRRTRAAGLLPPAHPRPVVRGLGCWPDKSSVGHRGGQLPEQHIRPLRRPKAAGRPRGAGALLSGRESAAPNCSRPANPARSCH